MRRQAVAFSSVRKSLLAEFEYDRKRPPYSHRSTVLTSRRETSLHQCIFRCLIEDVVIRFVDLDLLDLTVGADKYRCGHFPFDTRTLRNFRIGDKCLDI